MSLLLLLKQDTDAAEKNDLGVSKISCGLYSRLVTNFECTRMIFADTLVLCKIRRVESVSAK